MREDIWDLPQFYFCRENRDEALTVEAVDFWRRYVSILLRRARKNICKTDRKNVSGNIASDIPNSLVEKPRRDRVSDFLLVSPGKVIDHFSISPLHCSQRTTVALVPNKTADDIKASDGPVSFLVAPHTFALAFWPPWNLSNLLPRTPSLKSNPALFLPAPSLSPALLSSHFKGDAILQHSMATPLPPTFTVPASSTETRRDPLRHEVLPPLFNNEKVNILNIWKYLDWKHVIGLGVTPLVALYGIFTTELQTKTLVWSIVYYFATGLGITAGVCNIGFKKNILFFFFD